MMGEMQRRDGEDGSHHIVASKPHLDGLAAPEVPHGWIAKESGVGGRGKVVHELEIKHVQRRGCFVVGQEIGVCAGLGEEFAVDAVLETVLA